MCTISAEGRLAALLVDGGQGDTTAAVVNVELSVERLSHTMPWSFQKRT